MKRLQNNMETLANTMPNTFQAITFMMLAEVNSQISPQMFKLTQPSTPNNISQIFRGIVLKGNPANVSYLIGDAKSVLSTRNGPHNDEENQKSTVINENGKNFL